LWQILPPSVHPNKEEVRNVSLIDKDFEPYTYTRTRQGRVLMQGKNDENQKVSGAVFDALNKYAKAVIK